MTDTRNLIFLDKRVHIQIVEEPFCKKCMNPSEETEELCKYCINHPIIVENWFYNRAISVGRYRNPKDKNDQKIPYDNLSRIIFALKYLGVTQEKKKKLGNLIADGLIQMVQKYPFLIEDTSYLLIPPEYDIDEENLCKFFFEPFMGKLKKLCKQPIEDISDMLIKTRETKKNKDLGRNERFNNVRDSHRLTLSSLDGKKILILDDVCTSMATIWDISRELKAKKAGDINVLSFGRNLHPKIATNIKEFPNYLSFKQLLIYFSNLDSILDRRKIDQVNIEDLKIQNDQINCKVKDKNYYINIDFQNKNLTHHCYDHERRRYGNKSFCKHITKLFLDIQKQYSENFARERLNTVYTDLLNWNFQLDS